MRTVETNPQRMTFTDAVMLVHLLAFGDRSKITPEAMRTYETALSGLLSIVGHAAHVDPDKPIAPKLVGMRVVVLQALAWQRSDKAASALSEKGESDADGDEHYACEMALQRMSKALDAWKEQG